MTNQESTPGEGPINGNKLTIGLLGLATAILVFIAGLLLHRFHEEGENTLLFHGVFIDDGGVEYMDLDLQVNAKGVTMLAYDDSVGEVVWPLEPKCFVWDQDDWSEALIENDSRGHQVKLSKGAYLVRIVGPIPKAGRDCKVVVSGIESDVFLW